MSQDNQNEEPQTFICKLFDEEGSLLKEIEIDQELEEYELVDGSYYIKADEPNMPTEAMMEFINLGKLKVNIPQPISPVVNRTKEMLDDYKEYVLAQAALDDYKDVVFMAKNTDFKQFQELVMDLFYSRILRNRQTEEELMEFLESLKGKKDGQ